MSNLNARMRMPWDKLIEAFIANIPQRMELMKVSGGVYTSESELREFRTLEIHGPRQCGKTETILQYILKNDGVKFCIPKMFVSYYTHRLGDEKFDKGYIAEDTLMLEVCQPHCVDDFNPFSDVKVLIFDEPQKSAWSDFIQLFKAHPEWFHPEFMVIRLF